MPTVRLFWSDAAFTSTRDLQTNTRSPTRNSSAEILSASKSAIKPAYEPQHFRPPLSRKVGRRDAARRYWNGSPRGEQREKTPGHCPLPYREAPSGTSGVSAARLRVAGRKNRRPRPQFVEKLKLIVCAARLSLNKGCLPRSLAALPNDSQSLLGPAVVRRNWARASRVSECPAARRTERAHAGGFWQADSAALIRSLFSVSRPRC